MNTARVLTFGVFDPLHEGHLWLLERAKQEGDYLLVVVARDDAIIADKQRDPYQTEDIRIQKVAAVPVVDEVVLGGKEQGSYELLRSIDFDVLVVGYDQEPNDQEIRSILSRVGKSGVRLVRLPAHKPEKYKSTYLRSASSNA